MDHMQASIGIRSHDFFETLGLPDLLRHRRMLRVHVHYRVDSPRPSRIVRARRLENTRESGFGAVANATADGASRRDPFARWSGRLLSIDLRVGRARHEAHRRSTGGVEAKEHSRRVGHHSGACARALDLVPTHYDFIRAAWTVTEAMMLYFAAWATWLAVLLCKANKPLHRKGL